MTGRAAIVTCRQMPEPDVDEDLLMDALAAAGVAAELVSWDDPHVHWASYATAVIRSTWNYFQDLNGFLAWAGEVESRTELLNPAAVVRWNTHKGYLRELADQDVPVVPTVFVDRGSPESLAEVMAAAGWADVVAKPQVSAGSYLTDRVRAEALPEAEEFWHRLVSERDAMVQPYLTSVEQYGERSLIWIDGELTHAIRKSPRLGDADESVSEALPPAPEERELAAQVLALVPHSLLYARVDVVRDDQDQPRVMELELVEPSLFLQQHSPALRRLVAAIAERAA